MTAKLAVGEDSSLEEKKVRRPASAAAILGRPLGAEFKPPEVPQEMRELQKARAANARKHLQSAVVVFGSVDGARERLLDPEVSRSRV